MIGIITGTTLGAAKTKLLAIAALDRAVALDGLHGVIRGFRGLRGGVVERLIVGRNDRRIKRAGHRSDVLETGAQLVTRHHHAVRDSHCRDARVLSLELQVAHLSSHRDTIKGYNRYMNK